MKTYIFAIIVCASSLVFSCRKNIENELLDSVRIALSFHDFYTGQRVSHSLDVKVVTQDVPVFGRGVIYNGVYKDQDSLVFFVNRGEEKFLYLEITDKTAKYGNPSLYKIDFTKQLDLRFLMKQSFKQPVLLTNSSTDTIRSAMSAGTWPSAAISCCATY